MSKKTVLQYPFSFVGEFGETLTRLWRDASGLKELGGDTLGVEVAVDNTNQPADAQRQDSSDVENVKGKSSRTHYILIRDEDIERLCPEKFLGDPLVDFFMRW